MEENNFNILALDGGGSKGVYTLGVLQELEMKLGGLLYRHFDLIYGTSTGSIIASLLALGESVDSIKKLYMKLIPIIMSGRTRFEKSRRLQIEADNIFGDKKFDSFKTDVGIISLNYNDQKPLVFKSNIVQAHGMKQTFIPGFGCTISDAVQSSCSAYPVFNIKKIKTANQGKLDIIDGGYIANNPVFFAIIDANKAYGKLEADLRMLSIGTGRFVEKSMGFWHRIIKGINEVKFVERIIGANTVTGFLLSKLLFPDLNIVRIDETFNQPEYGTNMIEKNKTKLNKLLQLGRNSFANYESDIEDLFHKIPGA